MMERLVKVLLITFCVISVSSTAVAGEGERNPAAELFAKAQWITYGEPHAKWTAMPVLRKSFVSKGGKGTIAICGLGQYTATLNGQPLATNREVLTSGWTDTRKTCLYDVYTPTLADGTNVLEVALANGMYNVSGLRNRYTKFGGSLGEPQLLVGGDAVVSDGSWEGAFGPVYFSHVYAGDDVDARFPATDWKPVRIVAAPKGTLRPSLFQIRTFETKEPVSSKVIGNSIVYDFGQNAAYIPEIRVKGAAGTFVRLTFAEALNAKGDLLDEACGEGSHCNFVLKGDPEGETFRAPFFYRGYRYMRVTRNTWWAGHGGVKTPAADLPPEVLWVRSHVVHADLPVVGSFECSVPLVNQIHQLVLWAQKSNLMSVLTDCPHREKMGWQECYNIHSDQIRWGFDCSAFFSKCVQDMADAQLANGLVPDIAPEFTVFRRGFRDSPHWGSSMILVPWEHYEWTGDDSLIRRFYPNMAAYQKYIAQRSPNHITYGGLGDWYELATNGGVPAKGTPANLTSTVYYYYDTVVMANCAKMLGKTDEEKAYRAEAAAIRESFNKTWWNPKTGNYAGGSQTDNAMPIVWGLADAEKFPVLVSNIVADVRARGNAVTAGDIGYPFFVRALADNGRSDVLFDMAIVTNRPGYGYMIAHGETTCHEAWNCDPGSSHNHIMLGDVVDWFYRDLGGIRRTSPGFATFDVEPQIVPGLDWVKTSYKPFRYGKIAVAWKRNAPGAKAGTLTLAVPEGTTATVKLPGAKPQVQAAGTKTYTFEVR